MIWASVSERSKTIAPTSWATLGPRNSVISRAGCINVILESGVSNGRNTQ